jgi:hypothetical protein
VVVIDGSIVISVAVGSANDTLRRSGLSMMGFILSTWTTRDLQLDSYVLSELL